MHEYTVNESVSDFVREHLDNPGKTRIEFFKPSGKWYTTEWVLVPHSDSSDVHKFIVNHFLGRYREMTGVVMCGPCVPFTFKQD